MSEILEQPELNLEGSKDYGKFKDAESLLKAYSNLEAEFTKKSQKLAMLESENEKNLSELTKRAEQEKKVDEFVSKFEILKPFKSAMKESLSNNEDANLNEVALELIVKSYKTAQDYS
ncbi:MAG: hypothetical protein J6Q13_02965, partial [Clostridia bacterium]|nr:hypothetical protein [Clostridia bacterium]